MNILPFMTRFRTRLCLLIILLVVPAFGLVLWGNLSQRRIQTAAIQERASSLAELAGANQQDIINGARQLLGTLTQFPFLVLATNRPFCEWHFGNLLKLSPDYADFGLIETNGVLFCSGANSNAVADLGDLSYVHRVIQGRGFSVGDFQVGGLIEGASVSFGYPVLDEQRGLKRIVFSSLKLAKLSEAIAHIRLPEGGTIIVVDRTGKVLALAPNPQKWVGRSLTDTALTREILAQKKRVFSMPGIDGVPSLHATTSIRDGQSPSLFVCVSIPLSVSIAQANQALVRNLFILGLVATVVLVGGWFYSQRFFLKPVHSLAQMARALASGNLQARTGPIEGAAELVELGHAFNDMADRLGARQAELLQLNQELRTEIAEREKAQERIRQQNEDQRKLEQQLLRSQRMESLGALAGGIAHDLNNALAPILMGSELLRETDNKNTEKLAVLDLITSSAQRCIQMVKQILNFAKGSQKQSGPVRLSQIIREMAKIATDTFPKSIIVQSRVAPELWNTSGDSTELHQVLMNLCVNARDAMPQGGQLLLSAENVELTGDQVQAHPDSRPGEHILISVSDTGMGMSPEIVGRIFEPFFTTKTPDKGTGLGLSTVANVIKRHNGFLEVQSEPGKGTTFRIFLPAVESKSDEEPKPKLTALPTGHGELILVVDDEQMVLELAKTTLETYGYRVVAAHNGLEAIAYFEAHRDEVQLLITDTDMPFLNGIDAVHALQRIKSDLPIIIASGLQRETEHFRKIETSRVTTLSKPYGVEQLLEMVARTLGHMT